MTGKTVIDPCEPVETSLQRIARGRARNVTFTYNGQPLNVAAHPEQRNEKTFTLEIALSDAGKVSVRPVDCPYEIEFRNRKLKPGIKNELRQCDQTGGEWSARIGMFSATVHIRRDGDNIAVVHQAPTTYRNADWIPGTTTMVFPNAA